MKILRDLREKHPWTFKQAAELWPELGITVERRHLETGDYTVEGLENTFCIERKSVNDSSHTLTWSPERFEREMERMAHMEGVVVIVEAPFTSYTGGFSDAVNFLKKIKTPNHQLRNALVLAMRFPRIRWQFSGTPEAAEMAAFLEMYRAAKKAGLINGKSGN